jgi:hypothetical protein
MYDAQRKQVERADTMARRPQYERTVQASVALENLTGTPEWDYFLSLVQARLEAAQKRQNAFAQDVLLGEVDPNVQLRTKLAYRECRMEADVLLWVIGLPKQALREAEAARERLRDADSQE